MIPTYDPSRTAFCCNNARNITSKKRRNDMLLAKTNRKSKRSHFATEHFIYPYLKQQNYNYTTKRRSAIF